MRWKKEDIDYLIENYPKRVPVDILVKHLGKSKKAIRHKAIRLGVDREGMLVKHLGEKTPRIIIDRKYYLKNRIRILKRKTLRKSRIKMKMVEFCGGKCFLCGYDKCLAALEFHHQNNDTDFSVTELIKNSSEQNVLKEVQRCMLVCANCHREIHSTRALS